MNIEGLKRAWFGAVTRLTKGEYLKDVRRRSGSLPDFTLFSSDCLAGIVYSNLDRKFLSPTINMWFMEKDFLKLCLSPEYYMGCGFRFLKDEEKDVPFPVGVLGEGDRSIEINFEHYAADEECVEAWNRRKERILWDNLFVVMSDLELSDEEYRRFYDIKAKRKIMFTWNPERADGKEIFQINRHGKDHVRRYSNRNLNGMRDFEIFFDYIKWLNMEDNFILEEVKE